MTIDAKTKQAIQHTYHCLIGCGIGEVLGMAIASIFGWERMFRILLAVILAFSFGYTLTYRSVRKHVASSNEAMKITFATDTVSIVSMELIGNVMELLIPGALMATIDSPAFWGGLLASMSIAFVITVPINRTMISRTSHVHHH